MTRLFALLVLVATSAVTNAKVVDLSPQRGRAIASIKWTDETGRARQLSEFSGYPLVLLPIYTRCQGACILNVGRLKQAFENSSSDPRQFRVLLFSFDESDSPSVLAKYRQRENIPLAWSIGSASQTEIDALLDSVGLQVGSAGTEFTHPNIVLFLDSNLRIAKWIYGTNYSAHDVDLALRIAGGKSDWIGEHAQLLYSLLLFAASILCVALFYYLAQLTSRRSTAQPIVNPS